MKSLSLLALWTVGSICAIAVAWAGVSVISGELIDGPAARVEARRAPSPPTTSERLEFSSPHAEPGRGDQGDDTTHTDDEADTRGSGPTPVGGGLPVMTPSGSGLPPPDPTSQAAPGPSDGAGPGPSSPPLPATGSSGEPSVTPTSIDPSPADGSDDSGRPTTTSAAAGSDSSQMGRADDPRVSIDVATETMTATLVGGTVSISYRPGRPLMLWSVPAPGYQVAVEGDEQRQHLNVVFVGIDSNLGLVSSLDAWWDNGPHYVIDETDASG